MTLAVDAPELFLLCPGVNCAAADVRGEGAKDVDARGRRLEEGRGVSVDMVELWRECVGVGIFEGEGERVGAKEAEEADFRSMKVVCGANEPLAEKGLRPVLILLPVVTLGAVFRFLGEDC